MTISFYKLASKVGMFSIESVWFSPEKGIPDTKKQDGISDEIVTKRTKRLRRF